MLIMLVRLIRILVFKHFRQQKQELNNEVKQQVYKQSLAIYLAIMKKLNQEEKSGHYQERISYWTGWVLMLKLPIKALAYDYRLVVFDQDME